MPFCLTRSFLFVTMRTINVLEWLVILVGPFTTFLILNCSSILFLSYNVSPRLSSNRLVLKSPRITIFENFVQIFSINFGNAVKNSLFWFGGRYIVPTRMSLESAFTSVHIPSTCSFPVSTCSFPFPCSFQGLAIIQYITQPPPCLPGLSLRMRL